MSVQYYCSGNQGNRYVSLIRYGRNCLTGNWWTSHAFCICHLGRQVTPAVIRLGKNTEPILLGVSGEKWGPGKVEPCQHTWSVVTLD